MDIDATAPQRLVDSSGMPVKPFTLFVNKAELTGERHSRMRVPLKPGWPRASCGRQSTMSLQPHPWTTCC